MRRFAMGRFAMGRLAIKRLVTGRRALWDAQTTAGALLVVAVVACARDRPPPAGTPQSTAAAAGALAGGSSPRRQTVLILGTSLTAGLGLDPDQAYPALLQHKIDSAGLPFTVVNAGVSGETSAGAVRRIDWLLRQPSDVFVLETGANDALRALNIDSTASNIATVIHAVRRADPRAAIGLVQMEAPPNLGPDYTRAFHAMYPKLSKREGVTLLPFLLQDVAGRPALNQADGMHPNVQGERLVAATVWTGLAPLLQARAQQPRDSGSASR
jgi:acyl-CoA thioesterase-1